MAEGILSSVAQGILGKLVDLAGQGIGLLWGVQDELEKFRGTVSTIQAVLRDAEELQVQNHTTRNWLEKLTDVVHEADDLVDDFSTEALRREVMALDTEDRMANKVCNFLSESNPLVYRFKFAPKIKDIRERLDAIAAERKFHLDERPVDTGVRYRARDHTHSLVLEEEVIGREDNKEAIIELLLDSNVEENVSILPIVGIGGLGKTALVQLVFNDENFGKHFEIKMWVCVSDNFDVKEIVEKILESVIKQKPENLQMDTLVANLKKEIDGKRYLLVLDDVWNDDWAKWNSLRAILKGGARGSRILVTTRITKVAEITKTIEPYVLSGLDDGKSWALFKRKAFEKGQEPKNSKIVEIGKEIVKKCVGVPLALRTIGSLLYFKKSEAEWLSFKNCEISKIPQNENDILPTLNLSYDHLPSHLKQCFAFCRLYPKDYRIDIPSLINLWIAEGFINLSDHNQCLENVGLDYFMDLVWRSFFQEVKKDEWGNVKKCKMHGLIHDLAIKVAGTESIILDSSVKNIDKKTRHVSFGYSLDQSPQIPSTLFKASRMRTFLLVDQDSYAYESDMDELIDQHYYPYESNMDESNFESIISSFGFLRVLDMHCTGISVVPDSISKLKHLRYLDLSGNHDIEMLPNSITMLQNLQTLRLSWCTDLKALPENIHKLVNLRCLEIVECFSLTYMPPRLGLLTNLHTLSQFVIGDKDLVSVCGGLKELHGLNNLRGELKIRNLRHGEDATLESKDANLKEKEHLQALVFSWKEYYFSDAGYDEIYLEGFEPHPNLQKLFVYNYGGVRFPSWLLSLSNLVQFTLRNGKKCQHLPPLDQLPHLKILKLSILDDLEYISESGSSKELSDSSFFPSLEELYLRFCPNLKGWWRKMDFVEEHQLLLLPLFPRLSSLYVLDCPKLTSMPLFPYLKEELRLNNASIKPLQQTTSSSRTATTITSALSTSSSTIVTSSFTPLSNLKSLHLHRIEELESLSEDWLGNLTSLENLEILRCPNLTSLPQGMRVLTSLQTLKIWCCSTLSQRCKREEGEDWPNISHIPNLKGDLSHH